MDRRTDWQFLDDRGRLASSDQRPERVVSYIQAGATLWEHGIRPAGVFGSNHDGDGPDPVKAGSLPLDGLGYLGSGDALDADALLGAAPDLVVAVTYGGGQVYGLDPDTAKHIEERVPLVVLDVGQGQSLGDVRARFAALARSLGAARDTAGAVALARATARIRALAHDSAVRPALLALSPASADSAYLARPHSWPDLRELTALGLDLVSPQGGPGTNWCTADWSYVAELSAPVLLVDTRANAYPLDALNAPDAPGGSAAWREAAARARVVPWNPEAPCSDGAHARFFDRVADAVAAAAGG
ncbi:ABC transporter substrate-binding protein [Streptomyces sp. PKU-MA01144]|uniref:ABC transporter substrate-binding protein n=1 Tax=Streptomyces sp. PKU-MA01144 TaxID=2729138 RepID=UPI00147CE066|nr:ABC transporter substrate-binding protein [Streptomyces sp. PKU-MA01144]NNJ06482.1 ABC transporter substrate-binding protein [Streptomyces sp. PKU-MA01144]